MSRSTGCSRADADHQWQGKGEATPRSRHTGHETGHGSGTEAVFSMIGGWVEDATVLDLYAGSGSFGLEALSAAGDGHFRRERQPRLEALRQNISGVRLGGTLVTAKVRTSWNARPVSSTWFSSTRRGTCHLRIWHMDLRCSRPPAARPGRGDPVQAAYRHAPGGAAKLECCHR